MDSSSFSAIAEENEEAYQTWYELFVFCGDEEDVEILEAICNKVKAAKFVSYKKLLTFARDQQNLKGQYFSSPKVEDYGINAMKYKLQAAAARRAVENKGD